MSRDISMQKEIGDGYHDFIPIVADSTRTGVTRGTSDHDDGLAHGDDGKTSSGLARGFEARPQFDFN